MASPLEILRNSPRASSALPSDAAALPSPASSQQRPEMQNTSAAGSFEHQSTIHGPLGDPADNSIEGSTYPPFQPFFTLVESSNDANITHPSVSYIFADDDHDPVTKAAIEIHNNSSSYSHRSKAPKRPPDPVTTQSGRRRSVQAAPAAEQPAAPAERCILVTLGADGRSIASAVSLTPDWHVDSAELSAAPTLDGESTTAQGGAGTSPGSIASRLRRGSMAAAAGDEDVAAPLAGTEGPLMLRIHGSGLPEPIASEEALGMGIDGLCENFKERLNELRRVVEAEQQQEAQSD